jgi:hypothetical protein
MSDFTFEPATKDQAKARIALAGPSGSGKTWTSLIIATALGDKIAVIDTERGSASKYAGAFAFDRLNMHRYDPRDLAKALAAAAQAAYDVVVVDSLSKFWSGQGGMLEQVDAAAKRSYGNNSFGGWKEARPMESAMIEALLGYPGHVIVTMRTKTHYDIIEDERGRKVPTKLGLKPEQREGIEYEFDIVGDMDLQNALTVSKSRCPALSGRVIQRPDASFGEEILAWLTDGKAAMSATDYRDALCVPGASLDTVTMLGREITARGLNGAAVVDDEGSTVTLRELAVRKYQDAAKEARSGNGHQAAPAEPAAQPARTNGKARRQPPEDAPPKPVVTDQEWLTGFTTRVFAITAETPMAQVEGQRAEITGMQKARDCTNEDASALTEMLDEHLANLHTVSTQDTPEGAEVEQGVLA